MRYLRLIGLQNITVKHYIHWHLFLTFISIIHQQNYFYYSTIFVSLSFIIIFYDVTSGLALIVHYKWLRSSKVILNSIMVFYGNTYLPANCIVRWSIVRWREMESISRHSICINWRQVTANVRARSFDKQTDDISLDSIRSRRAGSIGLTILKSWYNNYDTNCKLFVVNLF